MSHDESRSAPSSLAVLRGSFDQVFALPPPVARTTQQRLLALRIGADPYAIRVEQVTGLEKVQSLVALPGSPAYLLGLTGLRGRLVPVFSLSALLRSSDRGPEPWLILCGASETVGLAASSFDGQFEVAPHEIVSGQGHSRHVRHGRLSRSVLDLEAVLADRRARADASRER
jgi:chemotaxis signal transduction protein